ncbi:uncharacterized protein LY89DRAFT_593649 [Mollisia scopiformis]|uniref:Uncharacterized protein n=1 Tax=Mollisia scopiformis TaxID=149040 RepID=A0A194WV28_MOLSC|nr:uncharacterized protein LY89DRAFT_593649 [Mollisia scopiformis]KUJ11820.1 hypothetical protein LY89DRAFT_593649 [Mollisia scopiformis]
MSSYDNKDPLAAAKQAERELNSHQAKQGGYNNSDSANESGVNEGVETRFPGASVTYGSAASGAGDNREIPVEEGGDILKGSGQPTKARDFEAVGGPEDKSEFDRVERGGDDDVRGNVRQGGIRDGAVRNS